MSRHKFEPQGVVTVVDHPKWDSVMLICKVCRTRRDGPNDVKPKSLGKASRGYLKDKKPRPRMVFTSCLGLCPKGATAMAFLGRGMLPRIVAVESREQLAAAIPLLTEAEDASIL